MSEATGTPKVIVNVASGNLLRQIKVLDGVAGFIATAEQPENIGVVRKIFGYDDAVAQGYTVTDEPFLNAIILQFYNELGGNAPIWILGCEDTMTMAQMCTVTNANGIKKLVAGSLGAVNLVGVCRNPSGAYNPGTAFHDVDVTNALTLSKALCQYQQSINRPIRLFIEGRVVNDDEEITLEPNTFTNGFAGVVLGNDINDGSAAVGSALGRACKYPAHVKLGNGQNGATSLTSLYIGSKKLDDFYPEELDAITDAGYITFCHREGAAGYYFSVDNMGSTDDFRILVHGRVVDKAHRISAAATTPYLETSIRINADGTINDRDASYIEDIVKAQIRNNMAGQISDVDCNIPLDQVIIETNKLAMELKVLPLGYMTWIIINLGLTKSLS